MNITKVVQVESRSLAATEESLALMRRFRALDHQMTAQLAHERSLKYSFNPALQVAWQEVAARQYYYARVCMGSE